MVKESRCSFCGASEKDVLLIASDFADKEGVSYICPNCAKKLGQHFDEILGSYWNAHNDLLNMKIQIMKIQKKKSMFQEELLSHQRFITI